MKSTSRLIVFLACALVGALEAPRALHVLIEDARGPYQRTTASMIGGAHFARTPAAHATGRNATEKNANAFDGSAALVTLPIRR